MRYKAEIAAWFMVEFDDDGKSIPVDQAFEAGVDFIGAPFARLDDMEVVNVAPVTPK